MQVEIKTINDLNEEKWNRLLQESPHSTVYHTKTWAKVWEKSFPGSHSFFMICVDEKGDYCAGFPFWQRERFGLKSIYSMPFGTYGGLVRREKLEESLYIGIYQKLGQLLTERRIIKAQSIDFSLTDHYLQEIGFSSRGYSAYVISLDGIDQNDYVQTLTRERKKCIRQSQRRGVEVKDIRSIEDVKPCHQLSWGTRIRHGVKSTFPLELFENIFTLMRQGDLLRWLISLKGEKIIGTLINFVFKDTFYAWEGGSDSTELNARPNDALYVHSILRAKRNGFKFFNFGATHEDAEGMIRYKESWGAERKEYLIYEKKKRLGQFIEKIRGFSKK